MKKALLYAIILLISYDVSSQAGLSGISDSTTIAGPGERIRLFTDRNIYCVNDSIFLNCRLFLHKWARFYHVEQGVIC